MGHDSCFLPLDFTRRHIGSRKQDIIWTLNWGNINAMWEEMELPLHEKCYDVSNTRGNQWPASSELLPNATNISVAGFSCHFSSCSAKPCDPTVSLSLQGHSHILCTPHHTWHFDVLMEQMCVGSPGWQGNCARTGLHCCALARLLCCHSAMLPWRCYCVHW